MDCTLYDDMRVYNNHVIIGEVELFHVSRDVMTDGKIDTRKIDSVGRLGGRYYTKLDRMKLRRTYYNKDID